MAFPRRNWPRSPRTVLTDFRGLRRLGPPLWPEPSTPCCEVPPLPRELTSLPAHFQRAVQDGVMRAFREAPPIVTVPAPQVAAPFRSRPINRTYPVVVGSTDGTTASSVGFVWLALQDPGNNVPVELAYPADGDHPYEAFTLGPVPDLQRIHIEGIDTIASSTDAFSWVLVTVKVSGRTILDRVSLLALRDISIDVPPKSTVSFLFANRDPLSVFLLWLTVRGWQYTAQDQGNYLSSSVLREDGAWHEPPERCATGPSRRGGCP